MRQSLSHLAALSVALLAGACSSTNYGDPFGSQPELRLPERGPERREDAGQRTPPTTPRNVPDAPDAEPPPESMDAGTDAPPARSAFCSVADLVMCFEFEGSTKDSSVNALDPTTSQGITFIAGKSGQAAQFGSQSALRFGYSAMFDVPAATIEAWVSFAPGANTGVVFDADDRYAMQIHSNGDLECISAGGSKTGGTVTKGQFTHVACTFESGGKIRNYVGGVERDNGSGMLGTSNTAGAAIGGNSPSGDPLVGAIDSFRVFRRARTAAEIAQAAQ